MLTFIEMDITKESTISNISFSVFCELTLGQTPGEFLSDGSYCFRQVFADCNTEIYFHPVL
jgi:hypothetical protein